MGLPSGYTRLRYIESSGTQFLKTGIKAKSTLRVRLKFLLTSTANAGIFGYMQSASAGGNRCALFQTGGAWYLDFGTDTNRITGGSFSANTLYHVEFGNGYLKDLNTGKNIISGAAFAAFSKDVELSLCGEVLCGIGKWYEAQIYDNETLVRDFVPAKNSSGTVGLYDNVGGVFYTNAGTGAFAGELASGPVEGMGASLVDGVSYGIKAGKTMVGGTAYAITEGKTMVGGTGYLIGEEAKPIPVTITGSSYFGMAMVTINGVDYESAASTEVFAGDVIVCSIESEAGTARVYVNGIIVASTYTSTTYQWTVPECASIEINLARMFGGGNHFGQITITTT